MSPPHPDLPTSIRNEDLVDFLLTRFDEDEEAAQFAALSASLSKASLVAHVLRDVGPSATWSATSATWNGRVRAAPPWSRPCG